MSKFKTIPEPDQTQSLDEFVNMKDSQKKESPKFQVFNIRMPSKIHEKLKQISNSTGLSINALCLAAINKAVKEHNTELGL